jgi:carboxymethylenebutenolidase
MCHSDDSRPPAPPTMGAVGVSGDLTLTAGDGNRLAAFEAHPESVSQVGVVIMPDVRGLHAYYPALAQRFAEAGFHSIAIDYFGRTASTSDRSEPFEYWPHVEQTTPDGVTADVAAAVGYLRSAAGGSVTSVFTVGFCFGGRHSLRQSAAIPGLSGVVAFYGSSVLIDDLVDDVTAPLLILLGGADQNIPPESFDPLLARLAKRGVDARRYVYEGAPHSFFDRSFADHRQACDDAWLRVLEFTAAHSPQSDV